VRALFATARSAGDRLLRMGNRDEGRAAAFVFFDYLLSSVV
jgi:hypothetical protein